MNPLLSSLLLAVLIVIASGAENVVIKCNSDEHCRSSLLFCAAKKCKQKYEGYCVRREDCPKDQICIISAKHERGLCVENVYKTLNNKIRTVVSFTEQGRKFEELEPLTPEELKQFPVPYESLRESELECGTDHGHSHDLPFNRTKPNGWEACGKSTCDNPIERDKYSNTDRKTFILEWTVMNDDEFSSEAKTRIALATSELNNHWRDTGYSFKSKVTLVTTAYSRYVVAQSSCETPTPPLKCIAISDLISKLVPEWKTRKAFQVVPVKPQSETLAGAGFFPWDTDRNHGLILMNKNVVNTGYTTLAHELGHGFGLRHTFAGISEISGCSSPCYEGTPNNEAGDFCSDTPPMPRASVCEIPPVSLYPDPCNSSRTAWDNAPTKNLMSYGNCREVFTPQQIKRMRCYVGKEFKRVLYE